MMRILISLLALLGWVSAPVFAQAGNEAIVSYDDLQHPVLGPAGMVASQNATASAVGAKILEQGGNAVDAAVAVGFALQVALPRAGNIAGGGFMLVYDAASDKSVAIDYRETAPIRATRDMYLDAKGNVDEQRAHFSHLASGVPGTVAGMWLAHERFGRLPWKQLLEPAIELADNGIIVSYDLSELLTSRKQAMCRNAATCGYYYKAGGVPYAPGEKLVQHDLAKTLRLIAAQGPDVFYRGEIAAKIVAEMKSGGGIIDAKSLADYKAIEREPVRGTYRGYEIVTMPPPSSGGVHVIQMLNILEHFPVADMGAGSADNVHLLTEVMRLAFADRSKYLGDPDYYTVPVKWLTSKSYGAQLAATIDMKKARRSADVAPGVMPVHESEDTTHYSIMDRDGNVVSNTYTLNFSFGSGIAVPGAGFLLNNEMDDFVSKPGVPNAYGLLGGKANSIEARKRPLSSMTPTIVFAHGKPWFATGSPGGSMIITTVLQDIVNVIDHGMNIEEAAAAPRMHHQWWPDVLELEPGFSPDTVKLLQAMGHKVETNVRTMGSVQTVAIKDGVFRGASDPRRPNSASVGPGFGSK